MNDFVSKPFDPDELCAVLLRWIKPGSAGRKANAGPATAIAHAGKSGTACASSIAWSS